MASEISFLPEELRKKEDTLKQNAPVAAQQESELRFSIPQEEGEDVEVIEVDEGEIDQVLAGEPWYSKLIYRVTIFAEDLKTQLMQPRPVETPPKRPPQFFVPPPSKPKPIAPSVQTPSAHAPLVISSIPAVSPQRTVEAMTPPTTAPAPRSTEAPLRPPAGPAGAPAVPLRKEERAEPIEGGFLPVKPRIVPFAKVPRRVRVIKRIRKPVRVSFVSEEELRLMRVDIPKRRFTLITATVVFAILIGGGDYLLRAQERDAQHGLAKADLQIAEARRHIEEKQRDWAAFQDLEPRLKALSGLLDRHISPTRLLDHLERNTLPTVSYESFSLSPDGRVTLSVTADSFTSAARQIVALQTSGFFQKVEASNYAAQYDPPGSPVPRSVQFQATLFLPEAALRASQLLK